MRVTLFGLFLAASVLIAIGSAPAAGAAHGPAHSASSEPDSDVIPFDYDPRVGVIIIPVRLNDGPPLPFILDSGVPDRLYVDKAAASAMGFRVQTHDDGDSTIALDRLRIVGSRWRRPFGFAGPWIADVQVLPATARAVWSGGHYVVGLLGLGLLARNAYVGLDFVHHRLTVFKHPPPVDPRAAHVPFHDASFRYFVDASHGGETVEMAVDTGSSISVLPASFLSLNNANRSLKSVRTQFNGARIAMDISPISSVRIGDNTYSWRAAAAATSASSFGNLPSLIGLDFLSQYNVGLDFAHNVLSLASPTGNREAKQPAASASLAALPNPTYGVEIEQDGDDLVASYVLPGCPADRAGLKRWDTLLTIGGQEVNWLTDRALAVLLSQEHIQLTARHPDGTVFDIDLGHSPEPTRPSDTPTRSNPAEPGVVADSIPFVYDRATDEIVVQVRINGGKPLPFYVDTGMPNTLYLDTDVARQLKLALFAYDRKYGSATSPVFSLHVVGSRHDGLLGFPGLWTATDCRFPDFMHEGGTHDGRLKVAGAIGFASLARNGYVDIDFGRGRLTAYTTAPAHPPSGAYVLPLQNLGDCCLIEAAAGSYRGEMKVDTAAGASVVPPSFAAAVPAAGSWKSVQTSFLGQRVVADYGTIDDLDVGGASVGPLKVEVATSPSIFHNLPPLLGDDFLSHYDVGLDFTHSLMYLRPLSGAANTIDAGVVAESRLNPTYGAEIEQQDKDLVVSTVLLGSPSAAAGLRQGDVILRVGPKDVGALSNAEMQDLLNRHDVELSGTHADGSAFDIRYDAQSPAIATSP